MRRLINWLSDHRIWNILIVVIYFVGVVAPHKQFGTFLNLKVFKGLTIAEYNRYVLAAALTALAIYGLIFIINANKRAYRKKLGFYMVANVVLAVVVVNFLFVVNIEMIHFPQYALLAILVYPLIGNYTGTLIWTTLLGVVDEAYQYFYLAPNDTSYYDFNDVVADLSGAVFGLLLLSSLAIAQKNPFNIKKSTIWYGIGCLILVIGVTHMAGLLSIYPNDARPYHLLREWPEQFWSEREWNKVHPIIRYHMITPLEGLVVTCLLWISFSRLRPSTS